MQIKRVVWLGCIFLFTSILLSWLSYFYLRESNLLVSEQSNSSSLLVTISDVRSAIKQYQALPFLLSKQLDVQELLTKPNAFHLNRVRRYLEQINLIAGSAALLILDKSAQVAAFSNWREDSYQHTSFADSHFYQQAVKGEHGKGVWLSEDQTAWFYFSAPIYKESALIGVAVIRINVAKTLQDVAIRDDFFIADANQQIIYSNFANFAPHNLSDLNIQQFNLSNGLSINSVKLADKHYMLQQVILDDTGWKIGLITQLNAVKDAITTGLSVLIGCLVLGLFVLYFRENRSKKRSQALVVDAQLESEARGRYIINTAQSGLITLDSAGCITFINPLVMRKFDYSLAQLTTKTMHSLLEEIDPASPLNRVLNEFGSLDFKPITNCEVIAKRSDASFFPVMLSIKKMRDTPKAEYLVTIVDISKRKQLEQRLQELNEQLEFKVIERTQALQTAQGELVRSEKMIALGKMSTAIVHELNQPLTAFRNYLAIIDKVKQHPEAVAERLESLNHLVDNMAAITSQLRLFAYSNPHSDRQVKVFDVVKRVVSMMSSLISEQQIEFLLRFSPQAETAIINADNTRFEQVLSNLFKNAIDAMTTKAQLGKVRQLSLRLDCQNNNLVLTLTDTGGGVNSDQLASLFEPFYTTKEIGLGLGLGLSIVKSIVQDLQGAICFNNIEQPQGPNGLQFRLEFPLHQKRE